MHDGLFSFWTNQIFPQYISPILSIIYKDTESIICCETLVKIRFHFHSVSSLWPLEVLAYNTSQKQKCQKNGDRLLEFVMMDFPQTEILICKNLNHSAGDPGSIPGSGRSTGEGNGYPLQFFLSGEFHGQRSLAGYSPWGRTELDTMELLTFSLFFFQEKDCPLFLIRSQPSTSSKILS